MMKENSYDKAYEICKNTTIYTTQGRNLQIEENEYLEDIMPVLYKIVEQVKDIIAKNEIDINNIYITGLAAVINNIDLYFQENFPNNECELLTPFFIKKSNLKVNIKDYIEVNSAVALALQGVGLGNKDMNFKTGGGFEKMKDILTSDLGSSKSKGPKPAKTDSKKGIKTNFNIMDKIKDAFSGGTGGSLDNVEMALLRTAIGLLVLILMNSLILFEKLKSFMFSSLFNINLIIKTNILYIYSFFI